MSNFSDIILKPLTKYVKSNIKDNIGFLKTYKPNVTDDTVLVIFDVIGLYTNITHDIGLRAIENFVSNYKQNDARFKTQIILKAENFF